jgi:hypothetical protein
MALQMNQSAIIVVVVVVVTGILFYLTTHITLPSLKSFRITAGSAILFHFAIIWNSGV